MNINLPDKQTSPTWMKDLNDLYHPIIEELKKNFHGDSSYLSGVNDGMWALLEYLRDTTDPKIKE